MNRVKQKGWTKLNTDEIRYKQNLARSVTIVDYDPMWPTLYEKEKIKIIEALGNKALAIEHIGSTSVPGLGAKPIIDIMVCVQNIFDADVCVPLLKGVGYTDVTVQVGNPDWYYCLGKESCGVGYHLHLMKNMSVFRRDTFCSVNICGPIQTSLESTTS